MNPTVKEKSLFLQAFEGTNTQVPVWFMRQAGRYLPEYQAIRKKYSLNEMFSNPEIVAEVTCQPIDILNVDAAILFADILTLPGQMGFEITFEKGVGPVIKNPIQTQSDVENLHDFKNLKHITDSIVLVNERLPENIPLIGFAGSPFTVSSYLVEGGSSVNHAKLMRFIHERPDDFHRLMSKLTQNTINYYLLQKEAGIQAFQLFDTWAGILNTQDYKEFVLPYIQQIFSSIDLPSIYFIKNSTHLLSLFGDVDCDFVSVCHTVGLDNPELMLLNKGVQGNLSTGMLYAEGAQIEKEVKRILTAAKNYKKYIFNLGHGINPDVSVSTLKAIVRQVHEFDWK